MTDPQSWLEAQLAGAPRSLRGRVLAAVDSGIGGIVGHEFSAMLRQRAEELLAEAAEGEPGPETALTLLAADALVTLACQWAAERNPEGLREVV